MNMQKDIISILIKILLSGTFLFVWGVLFFGSNDLSPEFLFPNTHIFVGVFLAVILKAKLSVSGQRQSDAPKKLGKLCKKNYLLFIASVTLLGLQLFVTWNIVFRTSWDPGAVWYGAKYVALDDAAGMTSMSEYFSIYPNNLLLVYIYSRILKLNMVFGKHISNGILLLAMFQCVILTITGTLVFQCACHYVGVKAAWFVYLLYVILVGLSAWMVIPYSDSTGVIFPSLFLYLYIKNKETDAAWKRCCLLFLMVVFGVVGFQIKPMSVIVLIAAGGIELINWINNCIRKRKSKSLRHLLCVAVVVVTAFFITSQITAGLISQMGFAIDRERQLGWQHHLMLGANSDSNGGFNEKDLNFSSGFSNQKIKNAEEVKVFKARMRELGVAGYLDLFVRKASRNYFNGTFGWGGDNFYTEIYPARENVFCNFLRSWYYDDDADGFYKYNAFIRQILWFLVLVCAPFMAIVKRKYKDEEKVLVVSVLGLMLYLQLFESHSRYLFTFVPLFCIMAMYGYKALREIL